MAQISLGNGQSIKRTTCPLTRAEFRAAAKAIAVVINGKEYTANPKEMSTNSLGFGINDKMPLVIGGKTVTLQVGLNLTIIGSKELPLS